MFIERKAEKPSRARKSAAVPDLPSALKMEWVNEQP